MLKEFKKRYSELNLFLKILVGIFFVIYILVLIPCLIILTPLILILSIWKGEGDDYGSRLKSNYIKYAELIGSSMGSASF